MSSSDESTAPDVPVDDREAQFALEDLDGTDVALLNAVRAHVDENDPVPDGLVERIQFALTLDALHAEVAVLTTSGLAPTGTRGATTESVRTVTFTSQSLTTMVTLTAEREGTVRVDGWAAPGERVRVRLLQPAGERAVEASDDGRFVFEAVPPGPVTFVLTVAGPGGDHSVVSPTIEL